jgi:uncharacterized membrane protein YqaE (UPF0057 family)
VIVAVIVAQTGGGIEVVQCFKTNTPVSAGTRRGERGRRGTGARSARFTTRASVEPGQCMDVLRILLAIVLPPLGVFLQVGLGLQFWLNILLTLLGYVPGIIHAVWIILRR